MEGDGKMKKTQTLPRLSEKTLDNAIGELRKRILYSLFEKVVDSSIYHITAVHIKAGDKIRHTNGAFYEVASDQDRTIYLNPKNPLDIISGPKFRLLPYPSKEKSEGKLPTLKYGPDQLVDDATQAILSYIKSYSLFSTFKRDESLMKASIKFTYAKPVKKVELNHLRNLARTDFSKRELQRMKRKMIKDLFQILNNNIEEKISRRKQDYYVARILVACAIERRGLSRTLEYLHSEFSPSKT